MACSILLHKLSSFDEGSILGGLVGKFRPTIEIALIFLECVSDEDAKDQLVVSGKMSGITDSILPNNPSIQTEKIIWP